MAQSSALKKPVTERAETGYSLLRKVAEGWNASRCWIRYLLVGARNGVPGLVEFVLGNHYFTARQVAGELTALGEILPLCARNAPWRLARFAEARCYSYAGLQARRPRLLASTCPEGDLVGATAVLALGSISVLRSAGNNFNSFREILIATKCWHGSGQFWGRKS